jgi:hypothetical protein
MPSVWLGLTAWSAKESSPALAVNNLRTPHSRCIDNGENRHLIFIYNRNPFDSKRPPETQRRVAKRGPKLQPAPSFPSGIGEGDLNEKETQQRTHDGPLPVRETGSLGLTI